MDSVREMREELDQIADELARLQSHDAHDHGGAAGREDANADHARATLEARRAELEQRLRDTESSGGFKGAKDLDAEAFGTAPKS